MQMYRFEYRPFNSLAIVTVYGSGVDAKSALSQALPGFVPENPSFTPGFEPIVHVVESVRDMQDGRLAASVMLRKAQEATIQPAGKVELWFRPFVVS